MTRALPTIACSNFRTANPLRRICDTKRPGNASALLRLDRRIFRTLLCHVETRLRFSLSTIAADVDKSSRRMAPVAGHKRTTCPTNATLRVVGVTATLCAYPFGSSETLYAHGPPLPPTAATRRRDFWSTRDHCRGIPFRLGHSTCQAVLLRIPCQFAGRVVLECASVGCYPKPTCRLSPI